MCARFSVPPKLHIYIARQSKQMENPPFYKYCKPFLIVTKQNFVSAMLTTLILVLLSFLFQIIGRLGFYH